MRLASLVSAFVALTLFAASLPVYLDVGGVYSTLQKLVNGDTYEVTEVVDGVATTRVVVEPYLSESPYAGIFRTLLPLAPVALLVWGLGSIGMAFLAGIGRSKRGGSSSAGF